MPQQLDDLVDITVVGIFVINIVNVVVIFSKLTLADGVDVKAVAALLVESKAFQGDPRIKVGIIISIFIIVELPSSSPPFP